MSNIIPIISPTINEYEKQLNNLTLYIYEVSGPAGSGVARAVGAEKKRLATLGRPFRVIRKGFTTLEALLNGLDGLDPTQPLTMIFVDYTLEEFMNDQTIIIPS